MTQAEQLVAQAAQWQAAGRADMAAQLYAAALEQDPSKFAIRMQLAECLVYVGQTDQAAEQYLMVAQAYAARGRQQECLALCDRILAVAPHAFVYMSVGPMVRRIGRHARPLCARAAEAHLAAGRQTDGLQMLRLGAELDPHNLDVRRQLARIYQARHMKREAVETLLDAGNLLLQAKRYDEYVQVAEQILALEPRDIDTLRDLPRVYLELRKPHEAVRMLGVLTKVSPGDIVGYEILAQAFALIGRNDKALSVLERLVEELGATGQADKADAILNHARYWRPTDVGFLRSLKRIEVPRPKPQAPAAAPPREAAPEGTVVLSIADLLVNESRRAPAPGQAGGVQLTEAEGTLTLRLDELMLDEMQQAAGHGVSPPTQPPVGRPPPPPSRGRKPPPPSPREPPPPSPRAVQPKADATISLDAADLIEALTGEIPRSSLGLGNAPTRPDHELDDGTLTHEVEAGPETVALILPEDLPTVAPPGRGVAAEDRPTVAPPGRFAAADELPTVAPPGRLAAPAPADNRSISELIYDDDDGDGDVGTTMSLSRRDDDEPDGPTLLHMKPITAEDIARAMAQRQAAQPVAPPSQPEPPAWSPPPPAMPEAWSAPPRPIPEAASSIPDASTPDTSTMGSTSRPATQPQHDGPRGGMGDDAPTMARLTPLTAADIARALSQGSPTRPPPGAVNEDAVTVPPASRRAIDDDPEPPPLLPPMIATPPRERDEEEEEELTTTLEALRPEDLLRIPGRGPGGSSRR